MKRTGEKRHRNPGPSWGFALIYLCNRVLPWPIMRFLLKFGALVAFALLPRQRMHSRRFLTMVLGRPSRWTDSWRHFTAFAEFLVRRFDAAGGSDHTFSSEDASMAQMKELTKGGKQAIFGTFHFGNSDLMGFWISRFDTTVRMVRYRVENSSDIRWLERRFGEKVDFLWVNQPERVLFSLKAAVEAGHCIAMKCDRVEHSSKSEPFEFFGQNLWFPFSIYHLSVIFNLPVMFSFGVPTGQHSTQVYSSPIYYPWGADKKEKLDKARDHFRDTLQLLESLVRRYPYQWFNFLESNPRVQTGEMKSLAGNC